jgi:hypothetical protein
LPCPRPRSCPILASEQGYEDRSCPRTSPRGRVASSRTVAARLHAGEAKSVSGPHRNPPAIPDSSRPLSLPLPFAHVCSLTHPLISLSPSLQGTIPVYRYYNDFDHDHVYTIIIYIYIYIYIYIRQGTIPVYRYYNNFDHEHHVYTTIMCMCVCVQGTIPVYRYYNFDHDHVYTII